MPADFSADTKIYFRSLHGTVAVEGCQWWMLRNVLADLAVAMLGLDDDATVRRLRWMLPVGHRLRSGHDRRGWSPQPWRSEFATHFRHSARAEEPALLSFAGHSIDTVPLVLNTALRVGGDALKLAARLFGQAAVHGWVAGPHRAWLADQIQHALDTGVFAARETVDTAEPAYLIYHLPTRWDEAIELLRSRNDEPIVLSTGNGFPDPAITDLHRLPAWAGHSAHAESPDKWHVAVAALETGAPTLQISPDTWDAVALGHGLSVLDLRADRPTARIATAVVEPALVRVELARHLTGTGAISWSATWRLDTEVYDSADLTPPHSLKEIVEEILDDVRSYAREHIVVNIDWILHGDNDADSVGDAITALNIALPERVLSDRMNSTTPPRYGPTAEQASAIRRYPSPPLAPAQGSRDDH